MSTFFSELHPALVSFPVALVSVTLFFDIAGLLLKRDIFREVAKYNLYFATVVAILAYLSGHQASEYVNQTFTVPDKKVGEHFIVAKVFLFLIITTFLIRYVSEIATHAKKFFLGLYVFLLVVSFATLLYAGNLGGKLVFDYGAGVKASL